MGGARAAGLLVEEHCPSLSRIRDGLEAGVDYLACTQDTSGSWSDFWLPVGTSDGWVTAYVGMAMQEVSVSPLLEEDTRRAAMACARGAASWLLNHQHPGGGWGYNSTVAPDADSTAHVLSLLARLGLAVPPQAVGFLRSHLLPGKGYRTFGFRDPHHQWTEPCADVTAAALRGLHDVGELRRSELAAAWLELLAPAQNERGWWNGYWWVTPNYTTGLALEVWDAAGHPPLRLPVQEGLPEGCAFDLAWALQVRALQGDRGRSNSLARRLLAAQQPDGSWLARPILRVPPSHGGPPAASNVTVARDARRLFATASVVRALARTWRQIDEETSTSPSPARHRLEPRSRRSAAPVHSHGGSDTSERGRLRCGAARKMDRLIQEAALVLGFDAGAARDSAALFAVLTQRSLADPCPWPSSQLSSLAGGLPVEFSVSAGDRVVPALRYAVEVGDPVLAPYRRARSAIEALSRASARLGYEAAWQRVLPAVEKLASPELSVPEGLRFWVWGGVDQPAPTDGGSMPPAGLKIYLNLLHREVGRARNRLESALEAAAIPLDGTLRPILDDLDGAGFPHEMGFGMGPGGKVACKIYYELPGWNRQMVHHILERTDLPADPGVVCPEIPGILRESLAAKSRAGIALRLDPSTGRVRELTTAAAFPMPMLSPRETCRRVEGWILAAGWDAHSYHALSQLLLPAWEADQRSGRMNSLFTRTVSPESVECTVYLRPFLQFPDDAPRDLSGGERCR